MRGRAVVVALALVGAAVVGAGAGEVPSADARSYGSTPWSDATTAAQNAPRPCAISTNGLRALMLAPVWGETGAGSATPSPMTLSRWDNQAALYSFGNTSTYRNAFWHPGVGMWQFDSAGGGSSWGLATAAEHISTGASAGSAFAANEMAGRYCAAKQGGASDANARKAAWAPWHACSGSGNPCETVFQDVAGNGVSGDAAVGRYGGMVSRTCTRGASTSTFTCWYVDPAAAQGASGWASASWGQSPVTAPFYVYKDGSTEVRVWLKEDTGYSIDIAAVRPLGQNARTSLSWYSSSNLCLKSSTVPQTFCDVSPTHPFFDEIEWVAAAGVADGFDSGDFLPGSRVSRQAMSAFMYRLAASPAFSPPATASFADVPSGHQFFHEVEWLAAQGVTTGFPDGTFRPNQGVSREAMSAFMYRFEGASAGPPATPSFTDVPVSHAFFTEIEWLAAQEVSQGYADGSFRPSVVVTRQAMAAFLERLAAL